MRVFTIAAYASLFTGPAAAAGTPAGAITAGADASSLM